MHQILKNGTKLQKIFNINKLKFKIMKVIAKKSYYVDDDLTIYQRIVKLKDGSQMYQLQTSNDKKFRIYQSTTFTNLNNALKIMNQE